MVGAELQIPCGDSIEIVLLGLVVAEAVDPCQWTCSNLPLTYTYVLSPLDTNPTAANESATGRSRSPRPFAAIMRYN